MSLFAELKRRNVFRVSAAYLALGWIVTQVTSTVAPMLHLPEWVGPVVLWIGVIGFPFVVMFSWIYELTPEGLKRDSDVVRADSITHETARRLDYLVIALLVLAIGLFAWQALRGSAGRVTVLATTGTAATPAGNAPYSVAVLPFVDMSAKKDQEYFADGIAEELLNLLAQVPKLRVIARTSSFSFKGKEADIAEIARKLGVSHVLEGSVRTAGDKIRITAQLIRASDSSHVWSQTYDRQLNDVFAVQDDIAAAVVSQLKITLLGAAPKARTTDPKAYALYLQARQGLWQYNPASLQRAVAACRDALAVDPTYAPAWIALAMAYWAQIDLGVLPVEQGTELGMAAIAKALEHDPSYGPAYSAQAIFEGVLQRDYASAAKHLDRARELDPTNVDVINSASSLARRLGRFDLAIALARYLVSRDPVNVDGYDALALSYRYRGDLDQSIATYRSLLNLQPDSGWEHTALGHVLLQQGDKEAALREFEQEPVEYYRLIGRTIGYYAVGRKAESDAALAEVLQKYGEARPFHIATAVAYRGDIDGAFRLIERAVQHGDIDIGALPVLPEFAPLHHDPRWEPLLRRLGLAPDQLAAIPFDFKVPG